MKKLSLFNTSFRYLCQDLVIYQVSLSQTYYYWNGGLFNIARNLEKKSSSLMFWQSFCSKIYEKTAFFKYKFPKVMSRCINFLLLKWRPFQCNVKFETNFETKTFFITVLTRLLSKSLWQSYPVSTQITQIHFRI